MTQFEHDKIKPFSEQGEKKQQVAQMFDAIAPRYDFMNRFLSAGIDRIWRKKAILELVECRPLHLLDVATGTADMAIKASKILVPRKIIGIDISPKMLEIGRKKVETEMLTDRIELVEGDSETIKFNTNSFDAVMVAFGVRNFEHLEKGLSEILRVMRPGAKLVVLEFSRPQSLVIRKFYHLYMEQIAPFIAKLFRQNKKAYEYLNASARVFPERQQFTDILREVGFSDTYFKPLSFGICCIYCGQKPGD